MAATTTSVQLTSSASQAGFSEATEKQGSAIQPGTFDGLTILRYAPFYKERSNGGVEQSLRALNHGLLQRHRLTILQVHRVSDVKKSRVEMEEIGKGRVIWTPVAYRRTSRRYADIPARAQFIVEQSFQTRRQSGEAAGRAALGALHAVTRDRLEHLRHRVMILSDPLAQFLRSRRVDLLASHALTYDAGNLVSHAKAAGIPFVLVSHFDNSLFSEPHVRQWVPDAAGVGSVSGRGLPEHVRGCCVTLSDAINTEFFAPEAALAKQSASRPVILMPALVKPGKGQEDLLRAAAILADRKIDFEICFAGAVESEPLRRELQEYARCAGLDNRIAFLGELPQQQIRDYYALCQVVVLPSYTEGLPRVLLEAQAMQRPVVAYDSSGGIGETLQAGETGLLVKTGDVGALADRLGLLLTNREESSRMGVRGREFVLRNFSVAAFIRRHEEFYLKALGRKSK